MSAEADVASCVLCLSLQPPLEIKLISRFLTGDTLLASAQLNVDLGAAAGGPRPAEL